MADLLGDIAIEQNLIGNATVLNCQTRESALQAVLDGNADATYVYTYTAQSFVNNDPTASLQYSMANSMRFDFKMYVRNSWRITAVFCGCLRGRRGRLNFWLGMALILIAQGLGIFSGARTFAGSFTR